MATKKTAAPVATSKNVKFNFERETPGAVRFQEVDSTGRALKSDMDGALVGTLYLRKQALGDGTVPKSVTVSLSY